MQHNNQGFVNYKNLVNSILEDVYEIQDYPYNLSTVIIMISDAYRALGEDFPEGKSYKDTNNVTVCWLFDSIEKVYLEDRWKGGLHLRKHLFKEEWENVYLYNYHSPSDALIATLRDFMQND